MARKTIDVEFVKNMYRLSVLNWPDHTVLGSFVADADAALNCVRKAIMSQVSIEETSCDLQAMAFMRNVDSVGIQTLHSKENKILAVTKVDTTQ